MTRTTPFTLVAIDDSEDDIFILERLLQRVGVDPPLVALHGGGQGTAWLAAQIDRQTENVPDAVLLDLNMPGVSGLDVLQWIRRRKAFADTAVIMVSSTEDPAAIQRAHVLGAQCFLRKHPTVEQLAQVLRDARRFVAEPESRPLLFQGPYNRLLETSAGARAFGFSGIED